MVDKHSFSPCLTPSLCVSPSEVLQLAKAASCPNANTLEPTTLAFTSVIQKTLTTAMTMMDFSTRHYYLPCLCRGFSLPRLKGPDSQLTRVLGTAPVMLNAWNLDMQLRTLKPHLGSISMHWQHMQGLKKSYGGPPCVSTYLHTLAPTCA